MADKKNEPKTLTVDDLEDVAGGKIIAPDESYEDNTFKYSKAAELEDDLPVGN